MARLILPRLAGAFGFFDHGEGGFVTADPASRAGIQVRRKRLLGDIDGSHQSEAGPGAQIEMLESPAGTRWTMPDRRPSPDDPIEVIRESPALEGIRRATARGIFDYHPEDRLEVSMSEIVNRSDSARIIFPGTRRFRPSDSGPGSGIETAPCETFAIDWAFNFCRFRCSSWQGPGSA